MTGTAPLPAAGLDFAPGRLSGFLSRTMGVPATGIGLERVGGGQSNPTYFLTVGGLDLVLRKQPAGKLVQSAHDVAREFRIISALAGTTVPVPEPVLLCEDADVIGTPFYLMRRLRGRIFHEAALPGLPRHERREVYLAQARALAALHAVDWRGIGLADLARPGDFLRRQIDRWARAWGGRRAADVESIRAWLHARCPPAAPGVLVHGDFKLNNLVYDARAAVVIGVLDWELAAIGDPLFDLGHIWSATWATTPAEYGGVMGLDLEAAGLPSAGEFVDAYYRAAGTGRRLVPFYQVLALFRNAGIFHGIAERAAAGTAAAANAAQQDATALAYLDRALAITRESTPC